MAERDAPRIATSNAEKENMLRHMLPVLLGFALALPAAAAGVEEVIAHRGASAVAPQNTLAAFRAAIDAGASVTELDLRRTRDGILVCLHDAELSLTTNGKGPVGERTLAEVRALDAGSKFGPAFRGERVATVAEALALCRGKIGVLLDLKETGQDYYEAVAAVVRQHGEPKRAIVGVRSVEQAAAFKKLLPEARQVGLIPATTDIDAFADAGVGAIRLWPKWLGDARLPARVRERGCKLLIGAGQGLPEEVRPLLEFRPDWLSSDDPARLRKTLREF